MAVDDETRRGAEAWAEGVVRAALRADPDADPDLTAILMAEEIPERYKEYFALIGAEEILREAHDEGRPPRIDIPREWADQDDPDEEAS